MSKILVRGIVLKGPIEGIVEPPHPTFYAVQKSFISFNNFLETEGPSIAPPKIQRSSIEEGMLTAGTASTLHVLNGYLITNKSCPYDCGVLHIIQTASRLEQEAKINETPLDFFKNQTLGWCDTFQRWEEFWKEYKEKEVVELPEQIEDIAELGKYLSELSIEY